jgi:hypothetical protein
MSQCIEGLRLRIHDGVLWAMRTWDEKVEPDDRIDEDGYLWHRVESVTERAALQNAARRELTW